MSFLQALLEQQQHWVMTTFLVACSPSQNLSLAARRPSSETAPCPSLRSCHRHQRAELSIAPPLPSWEASGCHEASSLSPLLWPEHTKAPQPLLISYPLGLSPSLLFSLMFLCLFHAVAPKHTQCLKWGHTAQSRARQSLPSSSGSPGPDIPQGTASPFGCQDILWTHVQLVTNQNPQISFCRAALQHPLAYVCGQKGKKLNLPCIIRYWSSNRIFILG